MDRQKTLNIVVNHLRAQGGKAVKPNQGARCVYRAPDGKKCAVGALIPDEHYAPYMDVGGGMHASALMTNYPCLASVLGVNEADKLFLDDMQSRLHDSSLSTGDFQTSLEERVQRFADQYKLTVPEKV